MNSTVLLSVRAAVGIIVGVLVLFGLLCWSAHVAQVNRDRGDAYRRERDVADAERRMLERNCTFFVDGSASCPAGTFQAGAR